jgi:hypothetical protein
MGKRMIRRDGLIRLISGVILVTFVGSVQAAARNARTPDMLDESTQTASRRDQMRQEAQMTYPEVEKLLTEMLQTVRKNARPSKELLEQSVLVLEENKQNALAYDEKQRADYMLLQAWTGYGQGNLPEALSWSMRACKQDEASQDAWNSQAVFHMLSGKRPLEPKIEKPKPQTETQRYRPERIRPQPQRRNVEAAAAEYKPVPYSEKGTLEFNLLSLRMEMFRERFERLDLQTTDNQKIEYVPGRDVLCVLFWQSENGAADTVAAGDANDIGRPAQSRPIMDMGMEYDMSGAGVGSTVTLESQRQYFTMLMDKLKEDKAVKFVQVDTIRPRNLDSLSMTDYRKMSIPTVIAAHPNCNAKRLACDAKVPFMMIIDKDGGVKYAGAAADFVPAFILTELTGKPIVLEAPAATPMEGPLESPFMMDGEFGELMPREIQPAADPNAPKRAADPNQPRSPVPPAAKPAAPARQRPVASDYDFPMEDAQAEVEAGKLLNLAKIEIEESIKITGSNPKEGIEACRKVLELYPNTPYAKQAQVLLRRVPDRYKQRFNITDEEMGL